MEQDRDREIEHRLTKVEEQVSVLPEVLSTVKSMSDKLAKYEGRWGTITLIGAGLWGAFALFKDDIINWFRN